MSGGLTLGSASKFWLAKNRTCFYLFSFQRPETRDFQAVDGEDLVILACTVFDWSTRVMDGWTDGQTELRWLRHATAVACLSHCNSVAAVARKNVLNIGMHNMWMFAQHLSSNSSCRYVCFRRNVYCSAIVVYHNTGLAVHLSIIS